MYYIPGKHISVSYARSSVPETRGNPSVPLKEPLRSRLDHAVQSKASARRLSLFCNQIRDAKSPQNTGGGYKFTVLSHCGSASLTHYETLGSYSPIAEYSISTSILQSSKWNNLVLSGRSTYSFCSFDDKTPMSTLVPVASGEDRTPNTIASWSVSTRAGQQAQSASLQASLSPPANRNPLDSSSAFRRDQQLNQSTRVLTTKLPIPKRPSDFTPPARFARRLSVTASNNTIKETPPQDHNPNRNLKVKPHEAVRLSLSIPRESLTKRRRFSRPDLYIKAKIREFKEQRRESRVINSAGVGAPLAEYTEPNHLRIFVGTWNTECVPVSWRAFLTHSKGDSTGVQSSPRDREYLVPDHLKVVRGNPIKSTFSSRSCYNPNAPIPDSLLGTFCCSTSSGEESSSGADDISECENAKFNDTEDNSYSDIRPGLIGAKGHICRSSTTMALPQPPRRRDAKNKDSRLMVHPQEVGDDISVEEIQSGGPLSQWIRAGYDVYLLSLQECSSLVLLDVIAAFCSKINGQVYKNMELECEKISGYGDGATFFPKSTAIACICRADFIDTVWTVLDSYAYSFHKLNASKGAVWLVAEAMQQRILFIGCHLTPASAKARLQSRLNIRHRICQWLNIASFKDHFDHVIWTGDFNFRLREVKCRKAVQFLERHALRALLQFDEINDSIWAEDLANERFTEPDVNFFPTYKKVKGRTACDRLASGWIHREYAIKYKSQWYKGGRTKDRVPAWTDRVIKWSSEVATKSLMFIEGTYMAADATRPDNPLSKSDHSPVGVGLILGGYM